MESDADYTQTYAGAATPGPVIGKQGSREFLDAYNRAVANYGVRSPEAKAACQDAIANGWSPDGIVAGSGGGTWPSAGSAGRSRDNRREYGPDRWAGDPE